MKILRKAALAFLVPTMLASCTANGISGTEDASSDDVVGNAYTIMATFAPVYDLAKRVAGSRATVINVVGTNEPHDFTIDQAGADVMAEAEDSKLVVTMGAGGIDDWASDLAPDVTHFSLVPNTPAVTVYTGTDLLGDEEEDPHVWLDLDYMEAMANSLAEQLKALDPAYASYYDGNLARTLKEYSYVDDMYNALLSAKRKEILVTSHEAFGYLAREYGFRQMGISGVSDSEADASRIKEIEEEMVAQDIHYINVESLDEADTANAIKSDLENQGFSVELTAINAFEGVDDESWASGSDYVDVMLGNLATFAKVLDVDSSALETE